MSAVEPHDMSGKSKERHMIRLGKTTPAAGATAQPRRSQATLADLYQLYAQATRNPGQTAYLTWYSHSGDYSLGVIADVKSGANWRLSFKGKIETRVLWTLNTNSVDQ